MIPEVQKAIKKLVLGESPSNTEICHGSMGEPVKDTIVMKKEENNHINDSEKVKDELTPAFSGVDVSITRRKDKLSQAYIRESIRKQLATCPMGIHELSINIKCSFNAVKRNLIYLESLGIVEKKEYNISGIKTNLWQMKPKILEMRYN